MQLFSFPSLIHDYSFCKHEASLHILQSLCSAYHWPSFCNSTTRERWTQSGRGRPSKHGVKTQEVRRSETRGHVRNKIKQELRNLMLPACLDDSQFNYYITATFQMVSSEGGKTYHLSLSSTDRRYLTTQAMVKRLKPVSASGLINTCQTLTGTYSVLHPSVVLLTGTDVRSIGLSHAVLLHLDFADENKFQRPGRSNDNTHRWTQLLMITSNMRGQTWKWKQMSPNTTEG